MLLSVGIELIFKQHDFLSRIDSVAKAGLPAIELWGWMDKDIDAIDESRRRHNLEIAVLNLDPPVNVLKGDAIPALTQAVKESCEAAVKLGCKRITSHLQEVPWGSGEEWYSFMGNAENSRLREEQLKNYIKALKAAAPIAEDSGVTLMLEPLNTLVDHSGYFLSSSIEAIEIIRQVDSTALRLLFDCYHQQITEGNLTDNLTRDISLVEHIHVADVPGRNEPGTGEINFLNVLAAAKRAGYNGYVGLEYIPTCDSLESMNHIRNIVEQVNSLS